MKLAAAGFGLGALLVASGVAQATVSNVFVSNSDDTMSLIRCQTSSGKDPIRCREKQRLDVGFTASWPANQFDGQPAWWWTGLSGEVVGLKAKSSLSPLKQAKNFVWVDTSDSSGKGSGSNFSGVSPDGLTVWNSAREVDLIQEIDSDPDSPTFGTVLTEILVPDQDPSSVASDSRGAARPCDATMTPDGRFFLEPDLGGESLTVVDTWTRQIIHQVQPQRVSPNERVQPFMATTNGRIVLVENLEADNTYDIWDVSVLPAEPVHLRKLTQNDGLGVGAQTSEFTPDGRYAYLIMNGVEDEPPDSEDASRIDVLDVEEGSPTYLQIVAHIEFDSIRKDYDCGASTGDFSNDGRFFFVNCSRENQVAVIDTESHTVVSTVEVGIGPRGIVVR